MNATLISFSLFLILCVTFTAAFLIVSERRRKAALYSRIIGGKSITGKAKSSSQDQRRADLAKKLKEDEGKKDSKKQSINDKIMQAGLKWSIMQFWLFSVATGLLFFMLASLMGFSLIVKALITFTGFFGVPRFFLRTKIQSRQKKFMADFPDALESMQRLLKAGMPVSEAIKMVGNEFSGPMGEEMGRIFDQQKIGVPLPEAVLNASKRMPLAEMKMFATAIAIQTQTGSSLSEVLENLATVIRARFKLRRKVKALSAEAKASAGIIGALPILVGLGLYIVNRDYIMLLFTESTGKFLLGCAASWMLIGIVVMRQMINFRI